MALIHCHFYSHVVSLSSTMDVILPDPPPVGRADLSRPYPTLYLLHGLSDDHTIWQRRTSIERYVAGLNLAVVMPAVGRSFYANTRAEQHYWSFIAHELPRLARSYFPLSAARADNFVAGLSMGGYGAFKLALSYPERFAAAASLSGALDVVELTRREEELGVGELRYTFGPADELAGSANDLFALADELAAGDAPRPALYQWCGRDDHLIGANRRFRDHVAELGLALTYEEGPGGHEWACWDAQIQQVLAWLPLEPPAPQPEQESKL
jgi:S-formylglutathione hydrolase FrmB